MQEKALSRGKAAGHLPQEDARLKREAVRLPDARQARTAVLLVVMPEML